MINFLNIGNNTIISVHKDLGKKLKEHGFDGKVEFVEYKGILKMYGAAVSYFFFILQKILFIKLYFIKKAL